MNIKQRSLEIQKQIYDNRYYTSIYNNLLMKSYMHFETASDADIISFWNDFWFELPDSPAIHRVPFYDICDICESEQ